MENSMANLLRMVFGLQVTGTTPITLRLAASADVSAEKLVCERSDKQIFDAAGRDGVWTTPLPPGDYLVTLEAADWRAAKLTVSMPPQPGQPAPHLVRYVLPPGWKPGDSDRELTVEAWPATKIVIDVDPARIENPKDPWPPPRVLEEPVDLASSAAWFLETIKNAWHRVRAEVTRDGAPRKALPEVDVPLPPRRVTPAQASGGDDAS
jgi:hypothetical protein